MPKTGSRTLRDIVYAQYGSERVFSGSKVISERFEDWKQVPERERWSYARTQLAKRLEGEGGAPLEAVTGHMWYGWHELTDRPSQYVVFLRHPVRRYVSFYNHIRDMKGHPCGELIRPEDLGLGEFLNREDLELPVLQSNLQVKLLTGDFDPTSQTLAKAVENLRTDFLHVGLTETFDADLLCISNKLDWATPYYARRNTSTKYVSVDDLSTPVLERLIRKNSLDMALYEHVRTARSDRKKGREVRIFQFMNQIRNLPSVSTVRHHLNKSLNFKAKLPEPEWLRPR